MIQALDARSIYDVPLQYHGEGLDDEVLRVFDIKDAPDPDLKRWRDIMDRVDHPEGEVTIGVVGKYVGLPDAYKSLREALVHGGMANRVKVRIDRTPGIPCARRSIERASSANAAPRAASSSPTREKRTI